MDYKDVAACVTIISNPKASCPDDLYILDIPISGEEYQESEELS